MFKQLQHVKIFSCIVYEQIIWVLYFYCSTTLYLFYIDSSMSVDEYALLLWLGIDQHAEQVARLRIPPYLLQLLHMTGINNELILSAVSETGTVVT